MKKTNFKWVMFWLMVIITTLSAINGSTGLQLIPMFGFIGLAYFDLKLERQLSIPILVLSILMALLNAFIPDPSLIDVLVWAIVFIAWM